MERLGGATELLDGPLDPILLPGNLRDLELANRWLGGADLSWRAILEVGRSAAASQLSVLDVGTGAADIPRHLLRRAAGSLLRLAISATDARAEVVELARTLADGVAELHIDVAAVPELPYLDDSFDVVHSSLLLHHLEPEAVHTALADMARVARRAVIVNDLDRRRRWQLGAWLLSRLATRNRYTRHDAPLSVRRAYRPNELAALAAHAGLREVARLWARPRYRYALVLVP